MTANTSPVFVLTPNIGRARVAAANAASDGSGSLSDLFTAGANGSMVFRIRYHNSQASAALSSANVFRIFETDAAGANPRLIAEVAVPAATRTTAVVGAGDELDFTNGGIFVPASCKLQVVQSVYAGVQDQMDYVAEGGDF